MIRERISLCEDDFANKMEELGNDFTIYLPGRGGRKGIQ
jgi:hypothetical protein